ncbi:cytochrome b/b6 domain-containing protein [Glutamicibacter sp. JC586]|uniref:cytochrome b/b6 domain-containing protein n=1 Tax=Glutamicibacter sp. JC586 TaxID=2590552 RepID=UPI00135A7A8F|nr:cytochrome b/b6 domain-containing protein [Glutamicibacter sp. JC586]
MSSTPQRIRQGLPRVAGGEPWPPSDIVAKVIEPVVHESVEPEAKVVVEPIATAPAAVVTPPAATGRPVRQGLPRVVGGDPWPPSDTAVTSAPTNQVVTHTSVPDPDPAEVEAPVEHAVPAATSGNSPSVRQGLPREVGGEAWPPSSFVAAPAVADNPPAQKPIETTPVSQVESVQTAAPAPEIAPTPAPEQKSAPAPTAKEEPKRHGPLTTKQWVLAGILGAFCALGMATAVVLVARGIAGIDAVQSFLQRYPGEYHLPKSAPVGVPAWLAWNHFFNFFLMVLIIRSGMLVRHQKKPPAYWTSKRSPKVSINLWLHQALDLLWIINGLVFIILLFATGHWMRIIPTSWEVFPNAISAALQYLTLDWPTENGWVNYNSLQQIAYFVTVFIAAPLAAITGFRLSAYWPKSPAMSKRYPIEVARALHFPTMLYFVLFIVVHVVLVFSTGALRNLNHMYAAQGSTDPTQYAGNWVGLLYFALSLLVIAGAWIACRPMVLSSIAGAFGKVSSR